MADLSIGEPRFSAIFYESDYVSIETCCDVLVNGFAYAPFAKTGREVPMQFKLVNQGKELLNKQFIVKDNCYRELSVILFTSFLLMIDIMLAFIFKSILCFIQYRQMSSWINNQIC